MDASFDAFGGGGGWGMDGGENEFSSHQMHRSGLYEQIPIHVTISDLVRLFSHIFFSILCSLFADKVHGIRRRGGEIQNGKLFI